MNHNDRTIRVDRPGRQESGSVDLETIEQAVTFALAGVGRLPEWNRGDERLASVIADLGSATQDPLDPSPRFNNDRGTHT